MVASTNVSSRAFVTGCQIWQQQAVTGEDLRKYNQKSRGRFGDRPQIGNLDLTRIPAPLNLPISSDRGCVMTTDRITTKNNEGTGSTQRYDSVDSTEDYSQKFHQVSSRTKNIRYKETNESLEKVKCKLKSRPRQVSTTVFQ